MTEHTHESPPSGGGYGRWIFWGFIVIALFFLLMEHRAHVFQYLPFLLLAACPLLHMFHGHGGHGDHGGRGGKEDCARSKQDTSKSGPPDASGGHH